jgi:hypothetical protein
MAGFSHLGAAKAPTRFHLGPDARLLTFDWEPPPPPVSHLRPVREGVGAGRDAQGRGSRYGNDATDPSLAKTSARLDTLAAVPMPEDPPPDAVPLALPTAPVTVAGRRDLPLVKGGNGFARGDGLDADRQGGIYGLYVLHAEDADFGQAKRAPVEGDVVKVRVRLHADGIPFAAERISGNPEFFEACRKAALRWRFLVPERLKAMPVLHFDITFLPRLLTPNATPAPAPPKTQERRPQPGVNREPWMQPGGVPV